MKVGEMAQCLRRHVVFKEDHSQTLSIQFKCFKTARYSSCPESVTKGVGIPSVDSGAVLFIILIFSQNKQTLHISNLWIKKVTMHQEFTL